MIQLIFKGGFLVWPILLCSIFALAAFIEKIIKVYSFRINVDQFLQQIETLVRQNRIREAESLCDKTNSPVARIVRVGISNLNTTRDRIQNRMDEVALVELPKLEENLGVLAVVANISPLLGLLGTVVGMIYTFQAINEKTQGVNILNPGDLAEGLWVALVTTAFGISVAIPTLIAYNFLKNRVQRMQREMERAATRVLTWV